MVSTGPGERRPGTSRPPARGPVRPTGRSVLPSGQRPVRPRGARQRRRRRQLIVLWVMVGLLSGTVAFPSGVLSAPADFATPAPPKSALLLGSAGKVSATVRSPYQREEVP